MESTETLSFDEPHLLQRPRTNVIPIRTPSIRRERVLLQWRQLIIVGDMVREPNRRIVTTSAQLVPPPGARVRLRQPNCDGQVYDLVDFWIVAEVEALPDPTRRERRLRLVRERCLSN